MMLKQWLKVILGLTLLIYSLTILASYIFTLNSNILEIISKHVFHLKRRYAFKESVDQHLKHLEGTFEENVKNFFHSYNRHYKRKLTDAFQSSSYHWTNGQNLRPRCLFQPYLLIIVHSAPLNIKKRLAIRYSWGDQNNTFNALGGDEESRSFLVVFVVGLSKVGAVNNVIEEEGRQYGDILRTNLPDTYRSLSLKSKFAFAWCSTNCLPEYVLKTDDDCYVNVGNILNFLSNQKRTKLYTGRIQWFMPANREKTSKFYVPESDYPGFLLPPYASGGGYLFSGNLIPALVNASQFTRTIPNEDANTGLLMNAIKVVPIENNHILPYIYCNESIWIRPTCDFVEPYVMHGVQNYAQLWLHFNIKVLKKLSGICKQSSKYRKHLEPPLYCATDNT